MSIKSNQFKYCWFCNLKRGLSISGFSFIVTGFFTFLFYLYHPSLSLFRTRKLLIRNNQSMSQKTVLFFISIFVFFRKLKRSKKKQPTYNSILCSVLPWFLKTTDISHKKQGGEVEENTRERESLRSAFFLVEKFSPVAVSPLTACVLFSWTVHSEYSGLELLRSREGKRDLNLFQSIWLGWKLDCQSNFWRS